jgi:glycosyltransferase involved in cell wall biosynthesis
VTSIAAVILTLNEEQHIAACVDSVRWADDVLVFDSFSQDNTAKKASARGARVVLHAFENYAAQRNAALETVDTDWVLFVDADERATSELAVSARRVVAERPEVGWWIPRYNYIMGHRMRATGWYPDHQLRLMHRDSASYDAERPVHELVLLDGKAGYLDAHLIHYNYDSLAQFWAKQQRYLRYDVQILLDSGLTPGPHAPLTQAVRHIYWRLVTLEGYRDTVWGLALSLVMGYYEFLKYRRVRRLRRRRPGSG